MGTSIAGTIVPVSGAEREHRIEVRDARAHEERFIPMKLLKQLIKSPYIRRRIYKEYDELNYSQLGEQQVIINVLSRMPGYKADLPKTYLDIGGFDPIQGSNTYRLYQLGWKGVIVEPNPAKTKNWEQIRPNDKVITAAVVPDSWNEPYVPMICEGHHDAREGISRAINPKVRASEKADITYNARTIRLCDLLDECKKLKLYPTVLNLDIEGLEEQIVLDSGLAQSSIPLLCIEHFLNEFTTDYSALAYGESKLVQHLQDNYYLVSICGISLIFALNDLYRPFS